METKAVTKKRNGSILILIAAIIGVIYLIYSISYFSGANTNTASDAEAVGAGLATVLVMPHLICTGIAVMFNVLGFFLKRSTGFVLTAGILYTVAMVLFPMYFFFVIIEAIFCYVGFAKRKRVRKQA